MLTGDKHSVAEKNADDIGITHIEAECLPADKLKILKNTVIIIVQLLLLVTVLSLAAADIGIA